jgi:hypothetical protein
MSPHRRWLLGIVVGAVVGAGSLIGGLVAALLGMVAAILVTMRPPRAWPVGGLCLGIGAAWALLLIRADVACGLDCVGPDLTGWYLVAGALLALGVLVTISAVRAARPRT